MLLFLQCPSDSSLVDSIIISVKILKCIFCQWIQHLFKFTKVPQKESYLSVNQMARQCGSCEKWQTADFSSLIFLWICRHVCHHKPQYRCSMMVGSLPSPYGDHNISTWQGKPTNTIYTNTHKSKTVTSHKSSKSLDLKQDRQTNGDRREMTGIPSSGLRTSDRKVQV